MKKTFLLNSSIAAVIAKMGHTDTLTIGDAGLPIPQGVERIDLAVSRGIPSFFDILEATLTELEVEKITIAQELEEVSPLAYEKLITLVKEQSPHCIITTLPHEDFKKETAHSKAVIRSGECTPYVNIILQSGVSF